MSPEPYLNCRFSSLSSATLEHLFWRFGGNVKAASVLRLGRVSM